MSTPDIHESFHCIRRYQTVSVVQVKWNVLSRAPKDFLWHMVETGCKLERRKSWVQHHTLSCLCNNRFQQHTGIPLTCKLGICADWIAFWFAVNFRRPLQLHVRNDLPLACRASRQMTKSTALRQIQTPNWQWYAANFESQTKHLATWHLFIFTWKNTCAIAK